MHVPIAVLVLIVFALMASVGIILLLLCGVTNRFIGFSVAFEAIADDYAKCKAELKESNEDVKQLAKQLHEELGTSLLSQQQIRDLTANVEQVKQQKQYLTHQYVDMSNEYAWFRSLIRESDPDKYARANATIAAKRHHPIPIFTEAASCRLSTPSVIPAETGIQSTESTPSNPSTPGGSNANQAL